MNSQQLLFTCNKTNNQKFFIKMITIDHIYKKYNRLPDLLNIFKNIKKSYNMQLLSFLYNVRYGQNSPLDISEYKLIIMAYFLTNSELKLNVSDQDYQYLMYHYYDTTSIKIDNNIFNYIAEKIIVQILELAATYPIEANKVDRFVLNEESYQYLLSIILTNKTVKSINKNGINIKKFYKINDKDLYNMNIFKQNDLLNIIFYSKFLGCQ